MIFTKKVPIPTIAYNPETHKPVIKCYVCTGEQIAGFKDKITGHFTEIMLITSGDDIDQFMEMYDLCAISKEY